MTAGREGEVLVGVGGQHGRAVLVLPAGDGTCNTSHEVRHTRWHQIVVEFINFYSDTFRKQPLSSFLLSQHMPLLEESIYLF